MQEGVDGVKLWADRNKMELNAKKTKDMWSSFKKHSDNPPHLCINDMVIDRETEFKLLGAVIQDNLKWNSHISSVLKKANKRIYHIRACNLRKPIFLMKLASRPTQQKSDLCWSMRALFWEVFLTIFPWSFKEYRTVV